MGQSADVSAKVVEPVSPENPDSLNASLDRIQEDRVYSGHPADVRNTPEEDTPPADDTKQEPAEPPKDGDGKLPEGWEFKPKYKSHKDAELAYQEAERKMHEATQSAAALRSDLDKMRQDIEEVKAGKAKPEETPPAETGEEITAAYEAALTRISDLDPYDPDYHKQAAKAWAGTGLDKILLKAALDEVDKRLEGRLPAPTAPAETPAIETPPASAPADKQALTAKANEMARQAGLDMTPGSLDYRLFWSGLEFLPEGMSFQEEVNWLAKEATRMKPQRPSPEKLHRDNAVLERGGDPGARVTQTEQTATIGALLDQQLHRRVI